MQSCIPYFIKYKMLTLTRIYIMEVSKFVTKHASLFPVAKNQRPLQRSLRVKNELALPSSKLAMFQSGSLVMCIKIYNKLPNEINLSHTHKMRHNSKTITPQSHRIGRGFMN
ncbi:hypothetical protein PYW07_012973 [Mythimna separata]|uniref:Uncharacterized protein n=1 Tax=Mythimna separata TaxID=271217 RepID=A0AAD8DLA8_MYTSE|nr:hypothetical protein PYW07_012973 [Mythimna separata]